MPDLNIDKRLEAKIKLLASYYQKLDRQRELLEFLRLIRRPGWTRPSEKLFAHHAVDTLTALAGQLVKSTETMVRAARQVGK